MNGYQNRLDDKACVGRTYDKAVKGSPKVYDRLTSAAARLRFVTSKGGSPALTLKYAAQVRDNTLHSPYAAYHTLEYVLLHTTQYTPGTVMHHTMLDYSFLHTTLDTIGPTF